MDLIAGLGTPESEWQAWPGLAALPAVDVFDLVPQDARVLAIAPHPDDEVLAVGGILAQLSARHQEILLFATTDGTASHPGSAVWSPAKLGVTRPKETAEALQRMGIDAELLRLGLPDGDVARFEELLTRHLVATAAGFDVVLATWRKDGHPDHDAVGRAAAEAAAANGATLLEVPVWTWHWASPGDPRVPWERARRVPMPADVHERKLHAVAAYESQIGHDDALDIGAVLPQSTLDRLTRSFETVFLPA